MSFYRIDNNNVYIVIDYKGACYICGKPVEELRISKLGSPIKQPIELHVDDIYSRLQLKPGSSKKVCKPLDKKPEYFEQVEIWFHNECEWPPKPAQPMQLQL
jgi:hypothetical protein